MSMPYPPRIMRPSEAAYYAGMSKDLFNKILRPMVPVIELGDRGIGFDRIDLDEAIHQYKESHTRNAEVSWPKSLDSTGTPRQARGRSPKHQEESEFTSALQQVLVNKRKRSTTQP